MSQKKCGVLQPHFFITKNEIHTYNPSMEKMTTVEEIRRKLHLFMPVIMNKYQVESLGIFGSYIHNQQREGSDIDLLVTFSEPPSLFQYIELENIISELLGIQVDLVMKDALKPNIGKKILREVIPV